MNENERVEDDEELYRNVRKNWNPPHYTCEEGILIIQYHAFYDGGGTQPSVDRAKLLNFDPSCALMNDTNGIISIKASKVREIGEVNTVGDSVCHAVDVVFCPTCERPAHSQIIIKPEYFDSNTKQRNALKLLQRALARHANEFIDEHGWTLPLPK